MVRPFKRLLLEFEETAEPVNLRGMIGQEVPLSHYYLKGQKPTLVGLEGNLCILRYPNGVTMRDVPVRDLVDDSGYWKSE